MRTLRATEVVGREHPPSRKPAVRGLEREQPPQCQDWPLAPARLRSLRAAFHPQRIGEGRRALGSTFMRGGARLDFVSGGSDRRQFFSELLRETAAVVREVNDTFRSSLAPDLSSEDPWYAEAPVQARPTSRAVTNEQLVALCEATGLSARAAAVRHLARTSVRLTRAESGRRQQARSRLGGTPDLPAGFEWPRWNGHELAFLGQVDLAEVAALGPTVPVQARGLLLFFYDVAGQPPGLDPLHRSSCRAVHVDDDPARLERAGAERACLSEYPLELTLELMLPRSWSPSVEALDLDAEEMGAWDELRESLAEAQGVEFEELTPRWQSLHRLFGYPEELGPDMELDCQLASSGISAKANEGFFTPRREELEAGAAQWRLLLQLSDDDELGTSWGESFGRLSLWIREEDLAAGAFERVWAILR